MGIIHEDADKPKCLEFTDARCELMVVERQPDEMVENWRIIELNIQTERERMTPKEMRQLGHWLVKESLRIGKSYTCKGSPRAVKAQA